MARSLDWERAKARDLVAAGRDQERADLIRTRDMASAEREWRHLEFGTPITTKYPGTCMGCGKPIPAGKRAHYSQARGLLHVGKGCRYSEATSSARTA